MQIELSTYQAMHIFYATFDAAKDNYALASLVSRLPTAEMYLGMAKELTGVTVILANLLSEDKYYIDELQQRRRRAEDHIMRLKESEIKADQ